MGSEFDVIVIGRGMMGAAAAKYLARAGHAIVLVGPDEPDNWRDHDGVFASHYDEGRITRTIDGDHDWAMLANRSIDRYEAIAAESGIAFFTEAGCLVVAPAASGQIQAWQKIAGSFGAQIEAFDPVGLAAAFPYFAFPADCEAALEKRGAGHISPRRLVQAQSHLAERAGATLVRDYVVAVKENEQGVSVATSKGQRLKADKVLLAAGAFSIAPALLPRPLDLTVFGRTVALFEVSEAQAPLFAGMPSLILDTAEIDIYLLPPIRYPDGKLYLKIGGEPRDHVVGEEGELRAWFRAGTGLNQARDHLVSVAEKIVPQLEPVSISTAACALSYTPSSYPMIGFASPRVALTVGCGGASAKSSDEIGRLGAELVLEGRIKTAGYHSDFAPSFK